MSERAGAKRSHRETVAETEKAQIASCSQCTKYYRYSRDWNSWINMGTATADEAWTFWSRFNMPLFIPQDQQPFAGGYQMHMCVECMGLTIAYLNQDTEVWAQDLTDLEVQAMRTARNLLKDQLTSKMGFVQSHYRGDLKAVDASSSSRVRLND